jgi:hypothetical protein
MDYFADIDDIKNGGSRKKLSFNYLSKSEQDNLSTSYTNYTAKEKKYSKTASKNKIIRPGKGYLSSKGPS